MTASKQSLEVPAGPEKLSHQCLICGTPLHGPFGYLLGLFGITRSRRNPNLCNRCNTHVEEGRIVEITVLFADLSSFTELTNEVGAERAYEIVDAFLQMCTYELVKRGAFIDKYVGDAVMAIFNVPLSAPDHAARAVTAASEILARTEEIGAPFGRKLSAGAGIASGWARVGRLGSGDERDFTAIGEVVNLAARLEAAAGAGEILAAATSYDSASPDFPESISEVLALKGFRHGVPAYRLRRSPGTPERSFRPFSPLSSASRSTFAVGSLIFALLGAPCAATVLLAPLAVATGLGSLFGMTSAVWLFDDWRVRLPLMAGAALGTMANSYTLWRASRQRKQAAQAGPVPTLSRLERDRTLLVLGSAVLTALAAWFELYAHHFKMHHP